jgi:hypothetical protein
MAAIVLEGSPPIPVRYETWTEWREMRPATALPPLPLIPAGARSCATCWGAGRIHEPAPNGEGLVPRRCGGCLGSGLVVDLDGLLG